MPANLIKLIANNGTREFRPDNVDLIYLADNSSTISIALVSGSSIQFETPSPADALVKLAELEAAFTSGTGIVTVTDENSAVMVTTTTLAPTTTTTTCPVYSIYFEYDLILNKLIFTIAGVELTQVSVIDPTSRTLTEYEYLVGQALGNTYIDEIQFDSKFGDWTLVIGGCVYTVSVTETTTTTTLAETTTTTTILV